MQPRVHAPGARPSNLSVSAPFPFSAIVGQDEMKLALLICAIDRTMGGVLVFGERDGQVHGGPRTGRTAPAHARSCAVSLRL